MRIDEDGTIVYDINEPPPGWDVPVSELIEVGAPQQVIDEHIRKNMPTQHNQTMSESHQSVRYTISKKDFKPR